MTVPLQGLTGEGSRIPQNLPQVNPALEEYLRYLNLLVAGIFSSRAAGERTVEGKGEQKISE